MKPDERNDTAVEIIRDAPLYQPYPSSDGSNLASYLAYYNIQFDCFCVQCGKEATFISVRDDHHFDSLKTARDWYVVPESGFCVIMECQRVKEHEYHYFFEFDETSVTKVGQHPTLEDIASSELDRFRKHMNRNDYAELKRAGGLFAHGIGIGSFVYLRRIFERLIEDHRQSYESKNGKIGNYEKLRMAEKIKVLSAVLPTVLVENAALYAILSVGIHELDEDTCKRYFPAVRAGIIAILEEDLQAREKERAAANLKKTLTDIASGLSLPKKGEGSDGSSNNSA